MKQFIFFIVVVLITMISGCENNRNKLNLSGTVKNVSSGRIYLQRYENKSFFTIDSTEIVGGKFKFTSKIKLPEIYGLSTDGSGENPFHSFIIFLDNNPINVELDTINEFENTVVKGSKEQDLLTELLGQKKISISEKIQAHPSSLATLYFFYRFYSYRLSSEEILSNIELLDPSLKNTIYVEVLRNLAGTLDNISIGKKTPNFTANTIDGKRVNLSDYLGNGYVLVDFWASWCPPCRKENPNLLKAYNQYKDRGFEIIGVSLDNKNEPWLKAIEKDGLTWTQLIDHRAWAGNGVVNYSVRLIPANFLIDKEGVIVARNLKEDDLYKTLEELILN